MPATVSAGRREATDGARLVLTMTALEEIDQATAGTCEVIVRLRKLQAAEPLGVDSREIRDATSLGETLERRCREIRGKIAAGQAREQGA